MDGLGLPYCLVDVLMDVRLLGWFLELSLKTALALTRLARWVRGRCT